MAQFTALRTYRARQHTNVIELDIGGKTFTATATDVANNHSDVAIKNKLRADMLAQQITPPDFFIHINASETVAVAVGFNPWA